MKMFRCQEEQCFLCDVLRLSAANDTPIFNSETIVKKQSFGVREVMFREGGAASHLYVVTKGYVKLTGLMQDGRVHGLRLVAPWQLIGYESMDSARHSYTAETLTPVEVCMIPFKEMRHMMAEIPEFSLRIVEALNRDLQNSNTMIRNLSAATAAEKIASLLLSIVRIENPANGEFPLPLSRTDMAEMLGLTLETVSRTLSRLMRDGIIWFQPGGRRLRVIDAVQLERLGGVALVSPAAQVAYS